MIEDIKRRQFLRIGLGTALLAGSAALVKSVLWPAALDASELVLWESYADALLPAGELPAASALGVPLALAQEAAQDRRLRRLLRQGLSSLERASRREFAAAFQDLSVLQRHSIVAQAAASPEGSAERIFFDRTRNDLFALYYAQPRAWVGLSASFPPQPMGFLEFASPPRG